MKKVYLFLVVIMLFAVSCDKTDISEEVSMETSFKSDNAKGGFDDYGLNEQANMFNGTYANNYLGRDGFPPYMGDTETYLAENPLAADKWYWPYRDIELVMKWNDAWAYNEGAWITNHMSEKYIGEDGKEHQWTEFYKIELAPSDAYKIPENANGSTVPGVWYRADGSVIGDVIWGKFAITQYVYNDPYKGYHGLQTKGTAPGFGH